MANRLSDAASPYLLQHKDNPVAWQPWDDRALAEAQAEDKPILLSIGYAACHWCHVMAHESFENEAIARLMNDHFVCIKVDREERPDLDHIYQHALALLGQQGGWPLTMFLTPAGEPFWGGTYFPPEARYGRPGFDTVLESVSRIWRDERARAMGNVGPLREALGALGATTGGPSPSGELARRSARRIADAFDSANGGLAGAPKFPQAPILALLWQQARRTGDPDLRHHVLHTLARMSQGGIYDHLGGGFARYAVDEIWLVPHFEKMLYDNALLIRLLADAWADTRDPLFAARVSETVGWLEREMRLPGGFASSLDADSEGEEGRYYVWTAEEIDEVLGPDALAARIAYGVTAKGNWEGRNILHRLHQHGPTDAANERRLRELADRLLARRMHRIAPARDDKVLADWNGLTIQALTRAAAVFDRPDWLTLAEQVFADVCRNLADGPTLRHAGRGERRVEIGFLDDYAFMTDAALTLFGTTGRRAYVDHALAWMEELERNFRSGTGAYFQAPADTPHLLVKACSGTDGPTPAGNAIMVGALVRLAIITGDRQLHERAAAVAGAFGDDAARNPAGYSTLLRNACLLEETVQLVIVGDQADPATAALRRAAAGHADPDVVVVPLTTTDELAPEHPAAGKSATGGRPTAYLCIGPVCQPPVTEPDALVAQFESRADVGPAPRP